MRAAMHPHYGTQYSKKYSHTASREILSSGSRTLETASNQFENPLLELTALYMQVLQLCFGSGAKCCTAVYVALRDNCSMHPAWEKRDKFPGLQGSMP
jgi:hypothetical protein